jgi:hypothetical protein
VIIRLKGSLQRVWLATPMQQGHFSIADILFSLKKPHRLHENSILKYDKGTFIMM